MAGLAVSRGQAFSNTRIKTYPDGSMEVLVCDTPIFGGDGWEQQKKREKSPKKEENSASNARSMRRARAQLRDLALCTPFSYFVTLTLDKQHIDRYCAETVVKRLSTWCDNQVRRKGLAYVLVPERHKEGAIHFHGFFNDALPVVDSGTMTRDGWKKPRKPRSAAQRREWEAAGARVVYNLPGWTLGFTTAIRLYGEYPRAVSYVCKYIGKAEEKIGGRWYYSGGALGRPEVEYYDCSFRDFEGIPGAYSFTVPEAGLAFVRVQIAPGCTKSHIETKGEGVTGWVMA